MIVTPRWWTLYFYPRPPRGGRRSSTRSFTKSTIFLSTPSARRATTTLNYPRIIRKFLSTPSARRATEGIVGAIKRVTISIHALREEGDFRPAPFRSGFTNFYPRPPRGGRLFANLGEQAILKFLSTPSARRATRKRMNKHSDTKFLSTPSARRATFKRRQDVKLTIFLSTPSARRATTATDEQAFGYQISIHALREEGDLGCFAVGLFFFVISIHALREEGDPRCSPGGWSAGHFYPRPPRGGRLLVFSGCILQPRISIHALREEGDSSPSAS